MRESHVDKQMVQMRLVRLEWRLAPQDPHRHHPQRIKQRHTQHCRHKSGQAQSLLVQLVTRLCRAQCKLRTHRHKHT